MMEQAFNSDAEAAVALAKDVAARLREGIAQRGAATLVTWCEPPGVAFLKALRVQPLDWSKLRVTLSDERWTAPGSKGSRETLLRKHLFQGDVLDAQLVSLWTGTGKPINAVVEVTERLARMAQPFDAVVLGLGSDGHVAGLYPGMPALDAMLNPGWALKVATSTAPNAPAEGLTLTMNALTDARNLYLSVAGVSAKVVYEAARGGAVEFPVSALLRQRRAAVSVFLAEQAVAAGAP